MPNMTNLQQVERELGLRATLRQFGSPLVECVAPLAAAPPDVLLQAVANVVLRRVRELVQSGWRPTDLDQIRARRLSGVPALCLTDVVREVTDDDVRLRSDAVWTAELREVTAGDPAGAPRPRLTCPGADNRWPASAILETAVEVLSAIVALPKLPTAAPMTVADERGGAEAAMLVKVRALLAKAERTEFEHEAEAFTAKAQVLMARHSIDEAMLAADGSAARSGTALHRIWLDAPYVRAKFAIVSAVARANRCEALLNTGLDLASVVGMASDARATVLLATSLHLQAARAVAHARPDPDLASSVKTYRRSFLFAFAARIGERLAIASADAQADVDQDRLLPVLVDRKAAVERAVAEAFPLRKSLRSSGDLDASGWAAGRAAADLARLGGATPLPGRR